MKTAIVLNKKSPIELFLRAFEDFWFRFYAFFQTILRNPKQFRNAYWSNSDCYIRIGIDGYISNGKIVDLNGEVTILKELIFTTSDPVKIDLSEYEYAKIKKLADEKHVSVKEILMLGIDKLQMT